jgi:hypothetical protein
VKLPPISIQNSKKATTMFYNFQPLTYKSYIQERNVVISVGTQEAKNHQVAKTLIKINSLLQWKGLNPLQDVDV